MAAPIALEEGQASANVEETSSEERQRRQQLEECEEGWRRLKDQILELQKMASLMKRRSRLPALRQMLRLVIYTNYVAQVRELWELCFD
ncbi:hypothetical protein OPV22_007041 [Ensete ventricosum]|uniref:BHLH domain-containing protein n=1 Tax=Ensete ventricosum TaxID=4639 RepID=A0AAV8RGD5_ENSVE|nr:hypothetical protein OPV22_007041 [Ensete ventricosum]